MSARVGSGGLQRGFLLSTNDSSTKAKATAKQKSNNKQSNRGMKAGFLLTHSSKTISTEKTEEAPQKRATSRSTDKKEEQSKLKQPGIAKGFLLSQPKRPKTKKDEHVDNRKLPSGQKKLTSTTNLSKELLDLETPSRSAAIQSSSSLLFLESDDNDKPISRSTLISNNASSRTPLISVLNESAASDRSTGKTDESESSLIAAQPLISIIKEDTSASDEVAGTHALTVPTRTTESQSTEYTTTMPNFSNSLNDTRARPSSAHIEKSQTDTETDRSMTFLEFQQVLLNMDWKNSLLGDKMVISWSSVYVSWAWMWLLDDASDSCPWLSRALLRHHPLLVKDFLSPIKPADKQKTLRILRFVQDYPCPTSKAEVPNNDWGMEILPHLCRLADQQKRSVLAQEAWNVSIMMINIVCVNGIQNLDLSTSKDLKMRTEYLLDLQLGWKESKRRKDTRSAAKHFLLREWIEASKACTDVLQWRQLVQGHPLDMDGHWGGLLHVCSTDRYYLSHNDDRDTPMIAWRILLDEKSTSNPAAIDRVLLLRGLLVDFTSKKKTESDSLQEEAIGRVLCTLDKVACNEECAIAVWMLRVLWCSTGGLPPDLKNFERNKLPRSIEMLMSKAVSISSRGAGEALADLFAESVLSFDNSTAAIERLTSDYGLNDSTISLLSRISSLGVACSVTQNNDSKGTELTKCFLQDIFITRLADCESVRIYLQSPESYTIWQNDCSHHEAVMTRLYDIMLTTQQNDSVYIEAQSAVAVAMAMVLEVSLSKRKGDTVLKTIACFDFERFDNFFQMWGQACRERLLTRKATQDTLFTDLVLACASAVFLSPSDPSLLAVFGAILGRNLRTSDLSESYAQTRACSAIDAIMGVCTEKLNGSLNNWDDASIFQRLAPLLLIRRVPIRYFVSVRVYNSKTSDTEEYEKWIPSLASSLATIIGFDDEDGDKNLTREEKRLAAEVAGRVLSFGGNHSSAFQCICAPFFADILELCLKGHTVSRKNSVILLRKARLALYAACCSFEMLEAGVDANYEEYMNVVHVALHVLGINQNEESTGTSQKEWDQLQKGCVEYLAICLLQAYRVSSLKYTPFRQISQIIQNALRDGSLELGGNEWILTNPCMERKPVSMTVDGITEMRLFNTLTLVAQRVDVTDGTLGRFAESTAWLIRWTKAKHHPIVIAAAMQVIFTLITRSRSLGCFDGDPRNVGRRLQDWALTELQMDINRGCLNEVLRLSALKLVLCLLSLGRLQSSSNQTECDQFISPEWMTECMDIIENLARYDPSDDVRNLSSQVLGML